jgi:hypothetical protein
MRISQKETAWIISGLMCPVNKKRFGILAIQVGSKTEQGEQQKSEKKLPNKDAREKVSTKTHEKEDRPSARFPISFVVLRLHVGQHICIWRGPTRASQNLVWWRVGAFFTGKFFKMDFTNQW